MSETELSKRAKDVAEMRALGIVRLREGDLEYELGPDPNVRPDEEAETQRTADAERLKQQREHRVRFGASGGLRPRVPT